MAGADDDIPRKADGTIDYARMFAPVTTAAAPTASVAQPVGSAVSGVAVDARPALADIPRTADGRIDYASFFAPPGGAKPRGPKQSIIGGLIDQASDAFTFGLDKDALAALSDKPHDEARRDIEERRARFIEDHPILGRIGWYGGMAAGLAIPLGKLGLAGKAAEYVLPNANLARAAAEGAGARTIIGQSAIAGAKTGAATGFSAAGDADQSLTARLQRAGGDAIEGGLVGGALGYPITKVANFVGSRAADLAALTSRARAEGADAMTGGLTAVADSLRKDGITSLDDIRAAITPTHGKLQDEHVVDILSRWGAELAQNGGDDKLARDAVRDALHADAVQQHADWLAAGKPPLANGQRPWFVQDKKDVVIPQATATRHVNALVNEYQTRNAIASQLHELVAAHGNGEAINTFGLYRLGVNAPTEGAAASEAVDFARGRQVEMAPRLSNIFQRHLGTSDIGAELNAIKQAIRDANAPYKQVVADFDADSVKRAQLADAIAGVTEHYNKTVGTKQHEAAKATMDELDKFSRPVVVQGEDREALVTKAISKTVGEGDKQFAIERQIPVAKQLDDGTLAPKTKIIPGGKTTEFRPVDSLDDFISLRSQLEDAIQESKINGMPSTKTAYLRTLKGDLDAAVKPMAPEWELLNAARANVSRVDRAYHAGLGLNMKAQGGLALKKLTEQLQSFEREFTPHERAAFTKGVMAQLKAQFDTLGQTHNAAKSFMNDRMRDILGRIVGKDAAAELYAMLNRATLATRTYGANKGSQTAAMMLRHGDLSTIPGLAATMHFVHNPLAIVQKAVEHLEKHLTGRKVDEATRILSTNTDRPDVLFRTLDSLQGELGRQRTYTQHSNAIRSGARQAVSPFAAVVPQRAGLEPDTDR